jgi:hypothetical protein
LPSKKSKGREDLPKLSLLPATDTIKKAHLASQMSFSMMLQVPIKHCCIKIKTYSDLSLHAFAWWSWHLHTSELLRMGCQGFIGPNPSAFLDKCLLKELVQI